MLKYKFIAPEKKIDKHLSIAQLLLEVDTAECNWSLVYRCKLKMYTALLIVCIFCYRIKQLKVRKAWI